MAVHLFAKNVHDDTIPVSIQMMSCKVLLNLVESIRVKSEQDTGARELLDGGVHTQVQSHSAVPDPRTVQTLSAITQWPWGYETAVTSSTPNGDVLPSGEVSFFFFTNEPARRYVTGGGGGGGGGGVRRQTMAVVLCTYPLYFVPMCVHMQWSCYMGCVHLGIFSKSHFVRSLDTAWDYLCVRTSCKLLPWYLSSGWPLHWVTPLFLCLTLMVLLYGACTLRDNFKVTLCSKPWHCMGLSLTWGWTGGWSFRRWQTGSTSLSVELCPAGIGKMKHLFEALGLLWGITNGGESMDYKVWKTIGYSGEVVDCPHACSLCNNIFFLVNFRLVRYTCTHAVWAWSCLMSSLSALSMISIQINTALLVNHNIFEVICCALYMHHVHVLYMYIQGCAGDGLWAETRAPTSLPVTLGRGVDEAVAWHEFSQVCLWGLSGADWGLLSRAGLSQSALSQVQWCNGGCALWWQAHPATSPGKLALWDVHTCTTQWQAGVFLL